ncbi:hypothetical protein ACTXT7_011614 [Hymenolepis weldensis]
MKRGEGQEVGLWNLRQTNIYSVKCEKGGWLFECHGFGAHQCTPSERIHYPDTIDLPELRDCRSMKREEVIVV